MAEINHTILVVDRNKEQTGLVKLMLKGFTKAEVLTAHNVDEAMTYFKNNPIDLVLTEVSLPGEDGYALLNKIKARKNIPVIAQTSQVYNDARRNCLNAGFNDYILKPFKIQELNALVAKYI